MCPCDERLERLPDGIVPAAMSRSPSSSRTNVPMKGPYSAPLDVHRLGRLTPALDSRLHRSSGSRRPTRRGSPPSAGSDRFGPLRAFRGWDRFTARRFRRSATDPSARVSWASGFGQKKPRPLTRIRPIMPTISNRLTPSPVPVNQMAGSPRRMSVAQRHQTALYRSRSRWRMISARVLSVNVMTNRSAADRKSVAVERSALRRLAESRPRCSPTASGIR